MKRPPSTLDNYPRGKPYGALLQWHMGWGTQPGCSTQQPNKPWKPRIFYRRLFNIRSNDPANEASAKRNYYLWTNPNEAPPKVVKIATDIDRIIFGDDPKLFVWRDDLRRSWRDHYGSDYLKQQIHNAGHGGAALDNSGIVYSGLNAETTRIGCEFLPLNGHHSLVYSATYSRDGQRIVTTSLDGAMGIWSARSGLLLKSMTRDEIFTPLWRRSFRHASFSPDGQYIVSISSEKIARVWDVEAGRQIKRLIGHNNNVTFADFSPDGRRIVTSSSDGAIVWDFETNKAITKTQSPTLLSQPYSSAFFSPDGCSFVTARLNPAFGDAVCIWDAFTGRPMIALNLDEWSNYLNKFMNSINYAAFSPDGVQIATASNDGVARIWDARNGDLLVTFPEQKGVLYTAAFSPDGARVVTACEDRVARVWDAASGHLLLALSGHRGKVRSAQFSPDGKCVLTASEDHSARVWYVY